MCTGESVAYFDCGTVPCHNQVICQCIRVHWGLNRHKSRLEINIKNILSFSGQHGPPVQHFVAEEQEEG